MSKSDRFDYTKGQPESPPPYSGDTQLWAEDFDNFMRRRLQDIESRLKVLEANAGIARTYNDASDRAEQGSTEG